ncbi:MAG: DUF5357 family protein [Leptolyngbyaceae cyanobacterium]
MIQFLKEIWDRITGFLFPQQYFAWQSIIYLALFSWAMSWVARLSGTTALTQWIIITGSWVFWVIGLGWALEANNIRPFGIPIAPWVSGALVCAYLFALIPGNHLTAALIVWPLVSVGLVALPAFISWELKPKLPMPFVRQQLILLLLLALLFSSWVQFYFRLQTWLTDYPTLLSDDFNRSGFVLKVASSDGQSGGIPLLTAAEQQVKDQLDDTPWPWVERWLLNLNGQMVKIRNDTRSVLIDSSEADFWELTARPRSLENGYALQLMAVWNGPASNPEGYFLEKTCLIRPRIPSVRSTDTREANESEPTPTAMAQVSCDLETPKRLGQPDPLPG